MIPHAKVHVLTARERAGLERRYRWLGLPTTGRAIREWQEEILLAERDRLSAGLESARQMALTALDVSTRYWDDPDLLALCDAEAARAQHRARRWLLRWERLSAWLTLLGVIRE